jgi:hypothetical protein
MSLTVRPSRAEDGYGGWVVEALRDRGVTPVQLTRLRPKTLHWRIVTVGVAVIGLLAAAHVVNRYVSDGRLFRVDAEANVPTWGSSFQFGLAGLACLGVAAGGPDRRLWTALGLLMLFFSLDEIATLHELLSAEIGSSTAEWIVQPPIGATVIALLLIAGRRARGPAGPLLLAAACALVLGHLSGLATPGTERGPVAAVIKVFEESFEMLLGTFVLAAAAARGAALGWSIRRPS